MTFIIIAAAGAVAAFAIYWFMCRSDDPDSKLIGQMHDVEGGGGRTEMAGMSYGGDRGSSTRQHEASKRAGVDEDYSDEEHLYDSPTYQRESAYDANRRPSSSNQFKMVKQDSYEDLSSDETDKGQRSGMYPHDTNMTTQSAITNQTIEIDDGSTTGESASSEDSDPRWIDFVGNLKKIGFFKDLVMGTAEYDRKLQKAKRMFGEKFPSSPMPGSVDYVLQHSQQHSQQSPKGRPKHLQEHSQITPMSSSATLKADSEFPDFRLSQVNTPVDGHKSVLKDIDSGQSMS